MATRSLSSKIEEEHRNNPKINGRTLNAELRRALVVIENEMPYCKHSEEAHRVLIKKLVQQHSAHESPPQNYVLPVEPQSNNSAVVILIGIIALIGERGYVYWPQLLDLVQ